MKPSAAAPVVNADESIVVFTAKSIDEILLQGGSSSWVLDPGRARRCKYVVCTRNANRDDLTVPNPEPSGMAFLVGRIGGLAPEPRHNGMGWLIRISDYALVQVADVWKGWRNPVKYASLSELGVRMASLKFQPMPEPVLRVADSFGKSDYSSGRGPVGLSIAEAKRGLALRYGIGENAIDITIRG